jgi:hypothetical protein
MNIAEEFLESEELVEKVKEKTLHRKRREAKVRQKQKDEYQHSDKKDRSGGRRSRRWNEDEDDV